MLLENWAAAAAAKLIMANFKDLIMVEVNIVRSDAACTMVMVSKVNNQVEHKRSHIRKLTKCLS